MRKVLQPHSYRQGIELEQYLSQKLKLEPIQQSSESNYELEQLAPDFITKIASQPFLEYCKMIIIPRKKLLKSIPVERIMRHQVEELDKALIIGPFKELQDKSKQLFQHLLMFSQDVASKQRPLEHVQIILSILRKGNQELIDEMYFQIIKQLTGNTTTIMMYAQLMAIVCSLYAPNIGHLGPILNYFYSYACREKTPLLQQYWKFYIKRICKTVSSKRTTPPLPTDQELSSLMNLRPLTINILVYGENQLQFEIEPDTKVGTIVGLVKTKLQLSGVILCMIQTIAGQIEESYLDDEQLVFYQVLEVVWEQKRAIQSIRERVMSKIQNPQEIIERIDGSCIFVIKTRLDRLESVQELSTAYLVTVQDYLSGYFTLNSQEIQMVGALKLTADVGHCSEHLKLNFSHEQFVPLYKRDEMSNDMWLKHILRMQELENDLTSYLKQDKMSNREARKRLVEYFKTQFTFMALRFQCRMFETADKVQRVIMHIGFNGVSCSSINNPRQPFLTNLEKPQRTQLDVITMNKELKLFYFKFPTVKQCEQAYKLLQNTTIKAKDEFTHQYRTAF